MFLVHSEDTNAMPRFLLAGDSHLIVEFGKTIDMAVNQAVHALDRQLKTETLPGLKESVPAYASLLIAYDPLLLPLETLTSHCSELMTADACVETSRRERLDIPVLYGGEWGPDLSAVALKVGLAPEEVIELHTQVTYTVYMMGFMPGYPYLGGLDPRLSLPRLATPRTRVPAGSVAIAELQAGVYPLESPGGWHLLGRTPLRLYRPEFSPPVLLRAGQAVRFRPVTVAEYLHIEALVAADEYVPEVTCEGEV